MKESQHLWSLIKKNFSSDAHMCRIENMAGAGIADVDACRFGVHAWIELKIAKGPRWRTEFRASQVVCLMKRAKTGDRVLVLVRNGDQIRLLKASLILWKGEKVVQLIGCPVEFATSKPFNYKGLETSIFAKSRRV